MSSSRGKKGESTSEERALLHKEEGRRKSDLFRSEEKETGDFLRKSLHRGKGISIFSGKRKKKGSVEGGDCLSAGRGKSVNIFPYVKKERVQKEKRKKVSPICRKREGKTSIPFTSGGGKEEEQWSRKNQLY